MISSRRPPTFIPSSPCSKPGTNPDAGWEIVWVLGTSFHEESNTLPLAYSAPT